MCEFPISAPGLLHLSTLLISLVCVTLGFMTHLHAPWVRKQEYRLCQNSEGIWKAVNTVSNVECPDISLETAFLVMSVLCLVSSILWYFCHTCCFGSNSKTVRLFYVIYLVLASVALVIAGVLYIKSAIMISHLATLPDYSPVVKNMGKVLIAALNKDDPDNMKLTAQSEEETFYQEKVMTGVLSIINGILHILCAWLSVLEARPQPQH